MELYDVGLGFEPYRWGIHTLPELAPHSGSPDADDRPRPRGRRRAHRCRQVRRDARRRAHGRRRFRAGARDAHRWPVGARHRRSRRPARRVPGERVQPRLHAATHARGRAGHAGRPAQRGGGEKRRSSASDGFAYYSPQAFRKLPDGPQAVADHLSDNVYITIDLDGIDPSQMAAVGTPEPGGLFWDEVVELLAAVAERPPHRRLRRHRACAGRGPARLRSARREADVPTDRPRPRQPRRTIEHPHQHLLDRLRSPNAIQDRFPRLVSAASWPPYRFRTSALEERNQPGSGYIGDQVHAGRPSYAIACPLIAILLSFAGSGSDAVDAQHAWPSLSRVQRQSFMNVTDEARLRRAPGCGTDHAQ